MPSSPDSSSDSSTGGSPHNQYDGPNIEAENCLPGVVRISVHILSYFNLNTLYLNGAKVTFLLAVNGQ